MKSYTMALKAQDPELTLRLPMQMIKDLVARSEENGRDINVEIMMRLARSLEKDAERDQEDCLLAAECLQSIRE